VAFTQNLSQNNISKRGINKKSKHMKAIFEWRGVKGKHLLEQVAAKLLWGLVSLEKLTSFLNPLLSSGVALFVCLQEGQIPKCSFWPTTVLLLIL
jgi:hypothetical protein